MSKMDIITLIIVYLVFLALARYGDLSNRSIADLVDGKDRIKKN